MNDILPPIEYYKPVLPNNFPIESKKGEAKFYVVDEVGQLRRVLAAPYDLSVED